MRVTQRFRPFLVSVMTLACTAWAPASPAAEPDAEARAALALATAGREKALAPGQAGCDCALTGACTCGAACDCPAGLRIARQVAAASPSVGEGPSAGNYSHPDYARAVREGRPLVIWVGLRCPAYEARLPGCVHTHHDEYDSDRAPRVVVGRPRDGWLWKAAELPGLPDVGQVQAAAEGRAAPVAWLGGPAGCPGGVCGVGGFPVGSCGPGGCGVGGCGPAAFGGFRGVGSCCGCR